jgi:polar amino acid transport system permease protein
MSDLTTERARPEPIKAVPVRRPWRWVGTAVVLVLVAMFIHMILTNDHFDWKFVLVSSGPGQRGVMFIPPVLNGLKGTILLTVFAMLIGVTLGILLAVMRLSPSPVLRYVSFAYVWFFRAVPRLVLCVLFGNLGTLWSRFGVGLPFDRQIGDLFGIHDLNAKIFDVKAVDLLTGFTAGMLALALSEAAYMAEIVRAGIQSIDEGQSEAAAAIGLSRAQTLRRIVLPQAMRVIVPPTGNETIAMVKDTSLVAYTPVTMELFFQMQAVISRTFKVVPVLTGAVLWYLIICSVLMVIQYYVERYFSRGYGQSGRARTKLRDVGVEHSGRLGVRPADEPGAGGTA